MVGVAGGRGKDVCEMLMLVVVDENTLATPVSAATTGNSNTMHTTLTSRISSFALPTMALGRYRESVEEIFLQI